MSSVESQLSNKPKTLLLTFLNYILFFFYLKISTTITDALMKSMIEQTKEKPKTFRAKAKEKMKTMNQKVRRKSTANEVSDKPPAMTVEELRNLTFTLMDKVDERDERIKFKEYEKREMFKRILKLEDEIAEFQRRDMEEEEEEEAGTGPAEVDRGGGGVQ